MSKVLRWLLIVVAWFIRLASPAAAAPPMQGDAVMTLIGRVVDAHSQPIPNAVIQVSIAGEPWVIRVHGEATTLARTTEDGSYTLDVPTSSGMAAAVAAGRARITLRVVKPTYRQHTLNLMPEQIDGSSQHLYAEIPPIVLTHAINPAFFIATSVFILMFGLISLRVLHETIAALLGTALILGVTYLIGSFNPDFWIISFERALQLIDFNVIFLILSMMIFMAIVAQTGVFQWLAYQVYQATRGNGWYVALFLTMLTGASSAVLNDVTVVLLIAPITIEICLALGTHPFAILIPEVLASNIGGAATIIGDPPSTLIASFVGFSFTEFLVNVGPISLLMMLVLAGMMKLIYGREYAKATARPSGTILAKLEEGARITDPRLLRKALMVAAVTMVLFFIEDLFRMPPSVAALLGATALLVWVRPNVHQMLQEVDWTTLVFFMALFIVVGGIEEVGLIQMLADIIARIAHDNLTLAIILIIWVSAAASALVANIPFTVAALPIAAFLSTTVPGAESGVLYWALTVGVDYGGNATYLGSAPNIVAVGLADRAGYDLSFARFARDGVPITLVTLLLSTLWILLRY